METTQKYIPGILGGMGPEATIDFMNKIIKHSHAKTDQDHLHLIIEHNPKVANRHKAISGDSSDVETSLVKMAQRLEKAGVDFIAMVCNTAHAFEKSISQATKVPFISIINEVINKLDSSWSNYNKIGIMAAEGCLQAKLYQNALTKAGYTPIVWNDEHLQHFMKLIYKIKAGNKDNSVSNEMRMLANYLIENGAQVLLIGCTEIPLVLKDQVLTVPVLNSTEILVQSVIDYALGIKEW